LGFVDSSSGKSLEEICGGELKVIAVGCRRFR
jgi:hypothetical protein